MAAPFPVPSLLDAMGRTEQPVPRGQGTPPALAASVASPGAGEQVKLSDETRDLAGAAAQSGAGLSQRMGSQLWNAVVAEDAGAVLVQQAQGAQGEALTASRAQLMKDYETSRRHGVVLQPQVEELVRRALGGGANLGPGGGSNPGGGGGISSLGGGGGFGGGGGGGGTPYLGGGGGNGGGIPGGNLGTPGMDRPWTAQDRDFLNQAITSEPQQLRNDMTSWRQGGEGNCAAVATIKAAIDRYDNHVFDAVSPTRDGGYRLQMQDGYRLSLSPHELGMARGMADFRGDGGPAQSYATLSFAAMAKRAQEEHLEGAQSYGGALRALDTGQDPRATAHLLGLDGKVVPVNPQTLSGQDSVVAWSNQHATYVDRQRDGTHVADHFGRPAYYDGTDGLGDWNVGAYTLRPRDYPSQRYDTVAGGLPSASGEAAPGPAPAASSAAPAGGGGSSGGGATGGGGGAGSSPQPGG